MPSHDPAAVRVRRIASADLTAADIEAIRSLLWAAFDSDDEDERFTEDDWQHALGGRHVVVSDGDSIVAHAAVVERPIEIGGRALRTGYVEAVASEPQSQRQGHGTLAMIEVARIIDADFELGVLGTGSHAFYERLGWRTWRGPSFVRSPDGLVATPDDDGCLLVLETRRTPRLDPEAPISCDWRPGDVW